PVININVDVAPLPGDDDAAGGVVNIPDATTLFGATTITGGNDEDTFNIVPQTNATSTIHINGGDPTAPLPADILNLNVNGLTGELNLIPTANGFAGFFTALGVEDVSFMNVETINPILNGGTLDVRVRWDLSNDGTLTAAPYNLGAGQGLGDDTTADTTLVSLSPGGTNLVIDANAMASVMQLALAGVNSLRVDGSGDDDDLVINDVNGLPSFGGTVPGVGNNGNIAGVAELSFNGGTGNDGIRFDLDLANTNGSTIDQTYAVGNGVGGGSGVGTSTGEILTTDNGTGTNLQIWFTGLEPITTAGTPGGTLTVLGDTNNNTIDVIPGPAGFTRIAATTPVFETFDFAANAFTALEVYGMEGADFIDLQAVDPAEVSLATIRLDGDTVANTDASADTVRVRTLPATSTANLFGGSGDDTFFVGTSGSPFGPGSTAGVLGQVFVSPAVDEGGNDTLQVSASNDPGRIVLLTSTTMEGITGFAGTPDVTYGTGDQIETIILITSDAADDTINIQSTRSGSVYNVDTGRFGAGNDT
ncbi:MAG: hypothetical protein KDA47_15140, partial [Planctomycetales bacterium]|nr:hypothetical protein [Planctomycetales bacterium]